MKNLLKVKIAQSKEDKYVQGQHKTEETYYLWIVYIFNTKYSI